MSRLTGPGDRLKAPELVPVAHIVSREETAHAHLAAGDAHDDLVFERERRARHRVSLHRVGDGLPLPKHATAASVERNQIIVERSDENATAQHRDTTIERIDLEWIHPLLLAMELPQLQATARIE